jgi:hypothetical protein
MVELPSAMRTESRLLDQQFDPGEYLYRRVPLEHWEDPDADIELDAIELPDMSVIRSKYAHPEWARFEGDEYRYHDWGVVGFRVRDVPEELQHLGVFTWTFRPEHAPLKKNYPHSEVRAFENGVHVDASKKLDNHLHLRWREQLARRLTKFLAPYKKVEVHPDAP